MRVTSYLIGSLLWTGLALGQTGEPEIELPRVYVRESLDARERLRHIRALEADAQWGPVAEECDRLVGEWGEQLVQIDPLHYRNVRDYVGEHRLGWPAVARRRYEELFAKRAAEEVQRLGQAAPAALWTMLAERYWPTAAGKEAARRAVVRLNAEGRVEAAARWQRRLYVEPGENIHPENEQMDWAVFDRDSPGRGITTVPTEPLEMLWELSLLAENASATPLPPLPRKGAGGGGGQTSRPSSTGSASVMLVEAAERVCVQAGGRLSAIGLYSGQVEWTFAPRQQDDEEGLSRTAGERGGLSASVAGERVFVNFTPYDGAEIGPSLLAGVETVGGAVAWQVEASPADLSGAFRPVEFFDGPPLVYDGHVYVVVRRRRELGFEDCRLACFEPATGERAWEAWIASGPMVEGSNLRQTPGRKVGRDGDIYVQTHVGVVACVDGVTGRVRRVTASPAADVTAGLPADGVRPGPLLPQVVATADGLTIVGDERGVRCFAPAGEGLKRLTDRAERRPDDCAVWLDLARFALARAEHATRGLEALDRAVACTAGMAATTRLDAEWAAARERERALGVVIDAVDYWAGEPEHHDEQLTAALLTRAAGLADTPEQQVRYRFTFADGYEQWGHPAEAVRLYQEVLDAAGLREVCCRRGCVLGEGARRDSRTSPDSHAGPDARTNLAGRLAERRIDELIRRHGREVYARFDAAAARMVRAGLGAQDAARLKDAAERYPNSDHAGAALATWVKLERAAGRPLAAARFAEAFIRRRSTLAADLQAAIIAQVAAAYADAGDAVEGLSWLSQGQRAYPTQSWDEDGKPGTFASLRQEWTAAQMEPRGEWPEVAPPLRKAYELERPHAILLSPQEQTNRREDCGDIGLVLLFTAGQIEALNATDGATLWNVPMLSVGTPAWLGTRGDWLIFATQYQLFALDRGNGALRWTAGEPPRRAASPAIDPEILTRITSVVLDQTVVVATRSDGRGMAVEIGSGGVLWERRLPRKAGGAIALNGQHVAYVAQGEPAALVVLAVANGEEVAEFPLDEHGGEYSCAFAPEGAVLVVGSASAACFDPYQKVRRWYVDDLRPGRPGSLLIGAERFYLAHDDTAQCRSYADGAPAWERDLGSAAAGAIAAAWLDAGRVYVLTNGGVAVVDASTGDVRGSAAWEDDTPVGPAWLTERHLLVSGVRRLEAEEGSSRWELTARWARRGAELGERTVTASLGEYVASPDVAVCGPALIVRAGSKVVGWTGGSAVPPPGPAP